MRAEGSEVIVVLTEPGALYVAREGFGQKGPPVDAEVLMIPEMTVNVSAKDGESLASSSPSSKSMTM